MQTKLDAICTLYKRQGDAVSGPLHSLVALSVTPGPMNEYWFGVAEIAVDEATFGKWIYGNNPNDIFLDIQLADGRSGHGFHLNSQQNGDVHHVSFFGKTDLSLAQS